MGSPAATDSALPVAARRHALVGEVGRRLRDRCGVEAGSTVLAGVSGGADSLALLVALVALRGRDGGPAVVAAHVHHHLRPDADADAAHVAAVCERFAVPLHACDIRPAGEPGNVAAQARRLRYDALAEAAKRAGARHVAVAHHAHDQLETMLAALCRGAGPAGLSGMAWSRTLAGGVGLVRPMLAVPGTLPRELCRAAGVAWRDDPTNDDPATARGRLRRDVVPALEALWPQGAASATRASESLAVAAAALEGMLAELFGDAGRRRWPRETLRAAAPAVIASGLRRAALDAAPGIADRLGWSKLEPAADAIRDAVTRPRCYEWPGDLVLEVTSRDVTLARERRRDYSRE